MLQRIKTIIERLYYVLARKLEINTFSIHKKSRWNVTLVNLAAWWRNSQRFGEHFSGFEQTFLPKIRRVSVCFSLPIRIEPNSLPGTKQIRLNGSNIELDESYIAILFVEKKKQIKRQNTICDLISKSTMRREKSKIKVRKSSNKLENFSLFVLGRI